ncbi:MAG: TolC family protein, partial [Bryobacteraceae bacterium]
MNSSVQVQGPYAGSVPGEKPSPGVLKLSLRDAIQRGLEYNHGAVGLAQVLRQARGQQKSARSQLLPNLNGSLRETVQQTNLRALGVRIPFAPGVVGPFNYFDLRATLTQNLIDFTALNNYRAAQESAKAAELAARDARDLVVLAVGGAYLQVTAAEARVESAQAQLKTAQAIYDQSIERNQMGVLARIDVERSQVQLQTQQQRVSLLENDLAKQKLNLARIAGLAPGQRWEPADRVPFSPAPDLTLEQALTRAYEERDDLKAAKAQVRAGERALAAAKAERLPSLAVNADYGVIGVNPAQSHGTFTVTGNLRIPIWQGGRVKGDIEQSEAILDQRRAELEDLRGRIDSDVRVAFLDLDAAASQVRVAQKNQE